MRAFQRAAQAVSRGPAKLTVVTYNILGDGEKLALSKKHDYCARELRLWASRCPRLVAEISGYGAGVVGLQECSARMFRDLAAGLSYGLPPGKLDQPESQPGLAGYHWADFVAADSKDEALASDTGLAAFVRTDTWKTVAVHARFLRELLFGSRVSGRLRKKLKTQSDAVLLLLLEHRPTQRRVLVANCHLYWDPHFRTSRWRGRARHHRDQPLCRRGRQRPASPPPPPHRRTRRPAAGAGARTNRRTTSRASARRFSAQTPCRRRRATAVRAAEHGHAGAAAPRAPGQLRYGVSARSSSDAHDAAEDRRRRPLVVPTERWSTRIGTRCAWLLLLSTHADDFAGTLDHLARRRRRRVGAHRGGRGARHAVRVRRCRRVRDDSRRAVAVGHLALGAVLQLRECQRVGHKHGSPGTHEAPRYVVL